MEGPRRQGAVKHRSEDGRQDAKAAALDADLAESYALDAISFAQGAIEGAEAASLDALYARANAVALSS
jgi:hypothetical protein